jgi:hypothetical protein
VGQIIIYADRDFGGIHTHLFQSNADLRNLGVTGQNIIQFSSDSSDSLFVSSWNDQVSSFVIISGVWQFFRDVNFATQQGAPGGLGPDLYPWVVDYGIDNDSLSSIRLVSG